MQFKVNICRHRQPHRFILLLERHRSVFNIHMLCEVFDLWHRRLEIRFDAHDLKCVLIDPGAAFQGYGDRGRIDSRTVTPQLAAFARLLSKMNLPGEPTLPSAQSFALHIVIAAVVPMKDHNRGRKSNRGNSVRKYTQILCAVSIFLDAQISLTNFRNGNDVVKGALLLANRKTPFIYNLMVQDLRGRDAVDTPGQFLNVIRRAVQDFPHGAGDASFHRRYGVIDVRGKPFG